MELIELPRPMRQRGFLGWPQVYRVGANEEPPPVGISYVIAEKVDFALVFRLMVPLLMKQHPYLDWSEVYRDLAGTPYVEPRIYQTVPHASHTGHTYSGADLGRCDVTIEQLAADTATYVDLGLLEKMAMVPVFMTDIREAITMNITNSFMWQDGYDKKRGICSGSLVEQPRDRSLIILDISGSIPDGISAGMLTLVKTMTDIVNADLILTGGSSYFFTRDEARVMDIREQRRLINRNNESTMFRKILRTHDMNYKNVITFGDSDNPGSIELAQELSIERWYSFFVMTHDRYGVDHEHGVGYGRWVKENVPRVEVIHHTDWARFFKARGSFCE